MQGTMKCAIYKDVKNIVVETRDIPTISSQDILVKNLRAGICGSDQASIYMVVLAMAYSRILYWVMKWQ